MGGGEGGTVRVGGIVDLGMMDLETAGGDIVIVVAVAAAVAVAVAAKKKTKNGLVVLQLVWCPRLPPRSAFVPWPQVPVRERVERACRIMSID